jgi:hypothetical protein
MAMRATPELTRRRDPDAQQETWLIYYGDVRVGVKACRQSRQPTWLAVELRFLSRQ